MSGAAARLFADPSHPGTEAKTTTAAAAQTPREWNTERTVDLFMAPPGSKMRNRGADISVKALPSFDHVNSWIQAIPTRGDVLQNSTDPRVPGRSAVIPAALWDR